ncbi:hypothetical protein VOLCADRAFT_89357 [Volvox carteri f. nagariensis]|uniref:Uncharacterized protein n=1 Tax=Volvox carteri f. nagariensis TaxID=3068 RepID=D8TRH7_VOLCA|nr:uncharacterized protein VOLCADRAFT_89357 [Volvox carteri f. nagariensis]EFJ49996.1 hypothetical protein VOLCADRAFT_89357 [Volvox carteri f. nagariensis]|eukprot:XP_002949061.1 hypothetical protein VOLCADRAFT_89357 [Volvox carteri f. nagariensis]
MVDNIPSRMFRCGWCGAVSDAAPDAGPTHLRPRPRRRGVWRAFMRLLSRLSYLVVLIVLALITSIVAPGIGFVLPRIATTATSWILHAAFSYFLTVGVLFNYLAATLTTPGTVVECCEDIPPAFKPRVAAAAGSRCSTSTSAGAVGSANGSGDHDPALTPLAISGDGMYGMHDSGVAAGGGRGGTDAVNGKPADGGKRLKDEIALSPSPAANMNSNAAAGADADVCKNHALSMSAVEAVLPESGASDGTAAVVPPPASTLMPSSSSPATLRPPSQLVPQFSYSHLRPTGHITATCAAAVWWTRTTTAPSSQIALAGVRVAAYVLLVSLGILVSVSMLLVQSIRHAVRVVDGVDPAAAQRAVRHHVHPASDAMAVALGADGPGAVGCAATVRRLRRVMYGSSSAAGPWMWIWPLWGPPPGVLVAALAPDATGCVNGKGRRQGGGAGDSGAAAALDSLHRSKAKMQ